MYSINKPGLNIELIPHGPKHKQIDGWRILTDNQTSCVVKVRRAQLNISETKQSREKELKVHLH